MARVSGMVFVIYILLICSSATFQSCKHEIEGSGDQENVCVLKTSLDSSNEIDTLETAVETLPENRTTNTSEHPKENPYATIFNIVVPIILTAILFSVTGFILYRCWIERWCCHLFNENSDPNASPPVPPTRQDDSNIELHDLHHRMSSQENDLSPPSSALLQEQDQSTSGNGFNSIFDQKSSLSSSSVTIILQPEDERSSASSSIFKINSQEDLEDSSLQQTN